MLTVMIFVTKILTIFFRDQNVDCNDFRDQNVDYIFVSRLLTMSMSMSMSMSVSMSMSMSASDLFRRAVTGRVEANVCHRAGSHVILSLL